MAGGMRRMACHVLGRLWPVERRQSDGGQFGKVSLRLSRCSLGNRCPVVAWAAVRVAMGLNPHSRGGLAKMTAWGKLPMDWEEKQTSVPGKHCVAAPSVTSCGLGLFAWG